MLYRPRVSTPRPPITRTAGTHTYKTRRTRTFRSTDVLRPLPVLGTPLTRIVILGK